MTICTHLLGAWAACLAPFDAPGSAAEALTRDAEPARLVVLISVDQLIPEQLDRLEPWLSGGFGRFRTAGRTFRQAFHAHGATETGPGHATLGTGMHPKRHGIVGNLWIAPDGTTAYCVGDATARGVTNQGRAALPGSSSAKLLLAPGLADLVRAAAPGSKSIGISFKDRAAILASGQQVDAAYWWDAGQGGFVSSDWYTEALPEWLVGWNEEWPYALMDDPELFDGERIAWPSSLPDDFSASGTDVDDRPGEVARNGRRTFPHVAAPVSIPLTAGELPVLAGWVYGTALADRFVIEVARHALREMQLGSDAQTDYLFLGLSACDAVGHSYGPYSHEVTDVILRADILLGELFEELDRTVGAGRWVAALSSDHGVLPLPEGLVARGHHAGRLPFETLPRAIEEIRGVLRETYGTDLILASDGATTRLDMARVSAAGVAPAEVRALIAEALMERVAWLSRVYTREELESAVEGKADALVLTMARSYHPQRSSDLTAVMKPWYIAYPEGTSHGTPWPYDRAVPMAFLGPTVTPGTSHEPCLTVDLVPTLMHHAGLPIPSGLDGRVLK